MKTNSFIGLAALAAILSISSRKSVMAVGLRIRQVIQRALLRSQEK